MASLVLGVCHIVYTFFFEHTIKEPQTFQGKAAIVFHDSLTGKLDTMDMEEYIKKQEKK